VVVPFDFRATVRAFRETLDRYQQAVETLIDFAPARAALTALDEDLETFAAHAATLSTAAVGDPRTRRTNRALRRLARLLVPVNYTRGPAFSHDPAETIPPLPDLAPALQFGSMTSAEHGFLRTHLVRGRNRLVAALRDARREVEQAML
jgi:hypothetical protein